ncbi:acyltransferase family protein [Pleionea litopenaei]|uniref:Acyltransferase n=1 Tax=Pleionea litopenaei TaxID=3070815 RepID=A0AA51RRH4_9GAMM|nr:acyltransferase [Pleionea sp. HL-JVS1]WMS86188.1 acyltransferase [Pleionea sp. HL-JVS1]
MEIRKLNMLRGLAALIVVVSHFSNSTMIFNGVLGKGAGQLGVMLFFILSGFLMALLYADRKFSFESVNQYFISRFARVMPLFLLVVIMSYVLYSLDLGNILYKVDSIESFLSHILMLSGESVLWTIPTEIQFYVIFVGLWALFQSSYMRFAITVASLFVILFFLGFSRPIGEVFGLKVDVSILQSLPYFLSGTLMGLLYRHIDRFKSHQHALYMAVFLLIVLMYPKIFSSVTGSEHGLWQDLGVWLIMSLAFFAITFLIPDDNSLLSNRVGDFLGKISYSLYLLHMPVLWQLERMQFESTFLFFALFVLGSVVVAYLSYLIIENPCRSAIKSMMFRIGNARGQQVLQS